MRCVNENRKKRKRLKFSRNKRKRQPIGMLGRSSGNHDWLLPTQALAFLAVFVYATHSTHTTLAIAFEWKPGLTKKLRSLRWQEFKQHVGSSQITLSAWFWPRNIYYIIIFDNAWLQAGLKQCNVLSSIGWNRRHFKDCERICCRGRRLCLLQLLVHYGKCVQQDTCWQIRVCPSQ